MAETWKQERPPWCPHPSCRFKIHSQHRICFGSLPEPEPHGGHQNTHRMCIHGAPDDGEWTFDLQICRGDGWAMLRLLDVTFEFEKKAGA